MPNWCSVTAHIACCADVRQRIHADIRAAKRVYEKSESALKKGLWLSDIISSAEDIRIFDDYRKNTLDPNCEYNYLGVLDYLEYDTTSITLYIESVRTEPDGFFKWLESHYPIIDISWIVEGHGIQYYVKHDPLKVFTRDNYYCSLFIDLGDEHIVEFGESYYEKEPDAIDDLVKFLDETDIYHPEFKSLTEIREFLSNDLENKIYNYEIEKFEEV